MDTRRLFYWKPNLAISEAQRLQTRTVTTPRRWPVFITRCSHQMNHPVCKMTVMHFPEILGGVGGGESFTGYDSCCIKNEGSGLNSQEKTDKLSEFNNDKPEHGLFLMACYFYAHSDSPQVPPQTPHLLPMADGLRSRHPVKGWIWKFALVLLSTRAVIRGYQCVVIWVSKKTVVQVLDLPAEVLASADVLLGYFRVFPLWTIQAMDFSLSCCLISRPSVRNVPAAHWGVHSQQWERSQCSSFVLPLSLPPSLPPSLTGLSHTEGKEWWLSSSASQPQDWAPDASARSSDTSWSVLVHFVLNGRIYSADAGARHCQESNILI